VRANLDALGLSAADLTGLRLDDRTTAGGVTHLRWRQEVGGVPAFDNELRVNVDADGRVINVLGAPRHDLSVPSTTPSISAAAALAALARNVGSSRRPAVTSAPAGARHDTRFSTGDRARLVLFGDVRNVRLAWHLTFDAAPDAMYDAVVDAETGRVLRRANLVKAIDASVFRNYPGAPAGGTQETVNLNRFLTNTVNPTALSGPNAHAWSDLNDRSASATGEAPDPGEDVVPGPYTFVPSSGATCDDAHICSWNHRVRSSWDRNRRQNAVQAFYYVNTFHDHLAADPIGFTAAQGSFEGTDPLDVETDDGANTANGFPDANHIDNANMSTPPDGQSPRMQMYLFENTPTSPFREVNGGDDASVVYHEYAHGLSNRLVTDADGSGALNSAQAGAMGEAWSDWYAKDFLNNEGLQADDPDVPGQVDMGAYVDATPHQIRNQALDCPVASGPPACPGTPTAGAGGFTYGDFGRIGPGPEVHNDGEIWAETLWDLRTALDSPTLTEELVTEAMRLSPPEPSFLDERNAIIQADQSLHDGVHVADIWTVFARRGMGFFAGTEDSSDTAPVESRATPPAAGGPTGRISGRATDSVTGAPLSGIVVGIGGLDTPPSSFTATTDANGAYAIGPVPAGAYPVLTFRPGAGYERFTTPVTVGANAIATANAPMRRDWAAVTAGAAVAATNDDLGTTFGCGADGAFDLSQGSGWGAYNAETPGAPDLAPNPHPGAPPTATVRLPTAVSVTAFAVNPSSACGDDASAATRDLRIEVSTDGTTFTTALEHTFAAADLGHLTTLPLATAIAGVRFVRISMLTNQSASAAGDDGQFFTDIAEVEVFGAPPAAAAPGTPAAPAGPAPAGPGPQPQPQPQPQPGSGTAPTQAFSRPTGAIAASNVRGRAAFTVGCALACRATATMTVTRATARRLHLSATRVATVTRRLAVAGRRTFALTMSTTTLRRVRARGVRTLSVAVSVAMRDARNQTRTVRRAVRVRIR
jgi:hypothetical protein